MIIESTLFAPKQTSTLNCLLSGIKSHSSANTGEQGIKGFLLSGARDAIVCEPEWAASHETRLVSDPTHCMALAYLTGGDCLVHSQTRKRRKGVTAKAAGRLAERKIGSRDYGSCLDSAVQDVVMGGGYTNPSQRSCSAERNAS